MEPLEPHSNFLYALFSLVVVVFVPLAADILALTLPVADILASSIADMYMEIVVQVRSFRFLKFNYQKELYLFNRIYVLY